MSPESSAHSNAPMKSIDCSDSHFSLAHSSELLVQRELMSHPEWKFHSLVVHRMKDGMCLQGVLECDCEEDRDEIRNLVRRVAGVTDVIDQLTLQVSKPSSKPPMKG